MPFSLYPATSGGAPPIVSVFTDIAVAVPDASAGSQPLAVIVDAPFLTTLVYDANSDLINVRSNNDPESGFDMRMNFYKPSRSALDLDHTLDESPSDLPGGYEIVASGSSNPVGVERLLQMNTEQRYHIVLNLVGYLDKTYEFDLKLIRSWAGVTITGRYWKANLS